MKKMKADWKFDAWDFIPSKNPIGEMATVHLSTGRMTLFAHSASNRLDIALDGSVVHLLLRDCNKDTASATELKRSCFNVVGLVYWIEEQDFEDLHEQLLIDSEINKIKNPKKRRAAKDILDI
jgi:hypothetical protein